MIAICPTDEKVLECSKIGFSVRDIKSKQVLKQELTAHKVTSSYWVDKDTFVTCSASEVTVWSMKTEDPISILDTERSDPVTIVTSKLSSKGRYSVAASSAHTCCVFKLNFNKA